MINSFERSYKSFKQAWSDFSLDELKGFISEGFEAREIREGEIIDFGYEESIEGWRQAFDHFSDKNAEWHLNDIGFIPVKADEMIAILTATITVDGETMKTANLFFNTFKKQDNGWLLIRSYIETGVPLEKLAELELED